MSTPLAIYMNREKISDNEFAVLIRKDRSLVNRIRRGEVRPTLDVAATIEAITRGEVTMQSWVAEARSDADHGEIGSASGALPSPDKSDETIDRLSEQAA
jgi:ribosome-binding protein aMBF1 (putative translation factor)